MDEVLKHYHIGKRAVPPEYIEHGWMTVTHKLTTESGECYILRQYVSNERRTPLLVTISFELGFTRYLYSNGLPVPMIPLMSDSQEQAAFTTKFEETLSKTIIHADFQQLNILFNNEMKTIAGVLDFDAIYYGPLLVDSGLSLTQFCYEGTQLNEEWLEIFLYKYEKERQINSTEEEWDKLFYTVF
jgi:Ser/Thr protein kinase RdoA (MazF antagonist)